MQEDAECSLTTMKSESEILEGDVLKSQTSTGAPSEEEKKKSKLKQVVQQTLGIVLALGLLWWCFRSQDPATLWQYTKETDLKFVLLVFCTGVLSHVLRAWRWVLLLKPLSGKPVSLWNSFCAVMYGYAVNIIVPRGGEVARLVSISKTESIPWAGVLPTMFIDRLLDIAMLVLLIGLTITQLPASMNLSWLGPTGASMCAASFAGLAALPFVGKVGRAVLCLKPVSKFLPQSLCQKLQVLLEQFDLGTRSLTSFANLLVIALSSLLIWVCYWANMYLMFYAFHLEKQVDLVKSLLVFTISSVSVLVPTPGSMGSYHALTSQSLQKIAGVNEAQSLAYAALTHLLCFVVITCIPAAICFMLQSKSSKR